MSQTAATPLSAATDSGNVPTSEPGARLDLYPHRPRARPLRGALPLRQEGEAAATPAPAAGPLRSATTLTLQTRSAAGLWYGRKGAAAERKGPYIIPVTRFAELMRQIEGACGNDDPYADWWFIQMEEAIQEARTKLRVLVADVERWTQNNLPEGVDVSTALSQSPEVVEVRFVAVLAMQTVYLVAEYDQLARKCLLARHLGLINRDTCEGWLAQGQRIVRSVLHKATGWKYTGVTRDDMAANNQRARLAVEKMGACPADILQGDRRSPFAPAIRRRGNLGQLVAPESQATADLDASDLDGEVG